MKQHQSITYMQHAGMVTWSILIITNTTMYPNGTTLVSGSIIVTSNESNNSNVQCKRSVTEMVGSD